MATIKKKNNHILKKKSLSTDTITPNITAFQDKLDTTNSQIDKVESSVGLEIDGTYIANTYGNYINDAVSLKDADNKLDTELKRVETDLVNTQEVDTVQKSNHVVQRYLYPITDFVHVKSTTEIDNVWGSVYDDGNYGKKYDDPLTGKTFGVYFTYNFGMNPVLDPRLGSHAGPEKIPTNIMFDIPDSRPQGWNPSTGEWDLRVRSVNGKDNCFGVGNDWNDSQGDNGAINNVNGNRIEIPLTVGQTTENYVEAIVFGSSVTLEGYPYHTSRMADRIRVFVNETEVTEVGVNVEDSFYPTVDSPIDDRYLNAGSLGKTWPLGSLGVHTVRVYFEDSVGGAYGDLYSLRIGKDDPTNPDKVIQPEQKSIINGSKYSLPKNVWNKKPNVREIGYNSSLDYGLQYWGRGETISEEIIGTQTNIDSGVDFSSPLNIFDFVYTTGDNKIHQIIDFKQDVLDATGTSTGHQAGNSSHCIWKSFDVNPIADITVGTGFVEGTVYYDELTDKAFWCIVSGDYVEENFAYRVPVNGGRSVLVAQADGTVKQSTLWMPPKAQVAGVGNITVDDRANGQHRLLFGDLGDGTGDELGVATAPHNDYESVTGIASASTFTGGYYAWAGFSQMFGVTSLVDSSGWATAVGNSTGWLQYEFIENKTIKGYGVAGGQLSYQSRFPEKWTLEGSDTGIFGGEEVSLDTQDLTGDQLIDGELRYFDVVSPQSFKFYRLNITENNGDVNYVSAILNLYESQKPIDMFEFQELAATRHVKEYGNGDVNGTGGRDYTRLGLGDATYWMDNGSDGMFGIGHEWNESSYGGLTLDNTDRFFNINSLVTGIGFTNKGGTTKAKGARVTIKSGDLGLFRVQQDKYEQTKPREIFDVFGNMPLQSNVIQVFKDAWVSLSYMGIEEIHFYQPKRSPLISKSDLVIGDWMIMADYVPATERGRNVIAKGTRRQSPDRDVWYDLSSGSYTSYFSDLTYSATAQYIGHSGTSIFKAQIPFVGEGISFRMQENTSGYDQAVTIRLSDDGGDTYTLLDTAGQASLGVNVKYLTTTANGFNNSTGILDCNAAPILGESIVSITGCDPSKAYVLQIEGGSADTQRYFHGFEVHTPIHSSEHHLEYAEPYINVLQQRHGVTMDSLLVLDQDGNTFEDYREPWRIGSMFRENVQATRQYIIDGRNIRGFLVAYAGHVGNRNVGLDWVSGNPKYIIFEGGDYITSYLDTTDSYGGMGGTFNKYQSTTEYTYKLNLANPHVHPKYKIKRRTDLT